jgi:hypothetical protein
MLISLNDIPPCSTLTDTVSNAGLSSMAPKGAKNFSVGVVPQYVFFMDVNRYGWQEDVPSDTLTSLNASSFFAELSVYKHLQISRAQIKSNNCQ